MSTLPEDDDLMAAEYVLGTLSLEERAGAETRLRRDPDFARAVYDWEGRLSDLNAAYAEVPAPDLMPKIEARLFPRPSPLRRGLRFFGGGLVAATLAGVDASFALEHHLSNAESVVLAPITDGRWSCLHWGAATPPFYPEPDANPVEDAKRAPDPMG